MGIKRYSREEVYMGNRLQNMDMTEWRYAIGFGLITAAGIGFGVALLFYIIAITGTTMWLLYTMGAVMYIACLAIIRYIDNRDTESNLDWKFYLVYTLTGLFILCLIYCII